MEKKENLWLYNKIPGSVKNSIKRLICIWKHRGLGIRIDRTCRLAANDAEFEGMNILNRNVSFKGRLGYGTYIGENSSINAVIGRYCSIASNVVTVGGTHPTSDFVSTHPAFFSTKKQAGFTYVDNDFFCENIFADDAGHLVEIGNDVWIGSNVLLLAGVHIGDGAVIGAGAVVVKDVEPYAVVGGVPGKVIRKRFNDEQINKLLEIKWWDMPKEWLKQNSAEMRDICDFLKLYN